MTNNHQKFGDVFFASLSREDHVQGGVRPVVIAQNNMGNEHSPTVGVIPMSSKVNKGRHLPVHVVIRANKDNGLDVDSVALVEQLRTIPSDSLLYRVGSVEHNDLVRIGKAIPIQFPFPAS